MDITIGLSWGKRYAGFPDPHPKRLIWVNPNKGSTGYEPLTLGMSTALPYVDDFLPGHNLASLESLAAVVREAFDRRSLAAA